MRHAFKVLCTEGVVTPFLTAKAVLKDPIQEECGVRLVFSNKGR